MAKRRGYTLPPGVNCLLDRNDLHWSWIDGRWTTDEGGTIPELEFLKYYGPFKNCNGKHGEVE